MLRILICFVCLFILTFPFPYAILPDIGGLLAPFFEPIIEFLSAHLFKIKSPYTSQILSDSTGLYIHTFFIAFISILLGTIWHFFSKQQEKLIFIFFQLFISYYLSLQLFIYGFNKVFKHQFYLPEPNTLFTPIGEASPDILYWTVMGSSYIYSVFAGILEIIPAILLLFRKTRLLGALIAMAVLINVVLINIGFDISVKLYSLFLLLLSVLIIAPESKRLFAFFIQGKATIPNPKEVEISQIINTPNKAMFAALGKSILIGLILFESLFIYFKTNNFNDDLAPRPFLHGAYQVNNFSSNSQQANNETIERFFIHRKGYFITQDKNGKLKDYQLTYQNSKQQFILRDYKNQTHFLKYDYFPKDSLLYLKGVLQNDSIELQSSVIDLKELPLLQKPFHWTIDE